MGRAERESSIAGVGTRNRLALQSFQGLTRDTMVRARRVMALVAETGNESQLPPVNPR